MDPVQESIKRLKGFQASAREKDAIRKLAYYNFETPTLEKEVKKFINRQKENDIPFSYTNIVEKAIDRKSCVYKTKARRIVGEGNIQDAYNDSTRNKASAMKVLERQTNLLGRIAFQVFWDDGRFGYNTIQFFTPLKIRDNKVETFIYTVPNHLGEEILYAYWSAEENYITDVHGSKKPRDVQDAYGVSEDGSNPYGRLPFIFPYRKEPVGGLWVEGAGDLVEANQKINFLLTLLNYLARYSSFKQPFAQGNNLDAQELEVGYNKMLTLEGEGSLGLIDLTANLGQIVDSIKFEVELTLSNNHLKANFGGTGSANSGFQLIVENIDLLTLWQDQVDVWRKHEHDLYDVEKVVYQANTNKKLPDKLAVDFAEVRFPINSKEQMEKDTWMLQNKLTSRLEIAKRENPDKPEDELIADLEKFATESVGLKQMEQPARVGLAERLSSLA